MTARRPAGRSPRAQDTSSAGDDRRHVAGAAGVLKQLDAGLDDPCKAVLVLGDAEELACRIAVTAKLRLDTWKGDDQARAGVGLCCDPETGYGLNLAFNRGQLQFVHDYVTWVPGCAFATRPARGTG